MGGGGGQGQSMLGGMMGSMNDPTTDAYSMLDPMGILYKPPPATPPFLQSTGGLPTMQTPQDTDRLAFLKAFGVQG
jgi:hypothetical protein